MTGAPVPADADTVIQREDADEKEGRVHILLAGCRPFMNISRQGGDLRAGEVAVSGKLLCGPPLIGLLASLGRTELLVESLPRVALLTTGDEVKPVDAAIGPAQIRNSNRWLLQSSLKEWGIVPAHFEHIPDDRPVLYNALSKLLGDAHPFDIIILSGGVSAGDADYVPGVLEELKVQKLFHKLAIKPGKPVWCGVGPLSSPTMVFALPGNPFSCLVNFVLLIRPYLHACFGLAVPGPAQLPLIGGKKKKTPLDEFFPVRTIHTTGELSGLEPVVLNGSGDIRLAMQADGLALHPAGADDLVEGTMISCYYL
jgi:molybdopterin molybdotransferase